MVYQERLDKLMSAVLESGAQGSSWKARRVRQSCLTCSAVSTADKVSSDGADSVQGACHGMQSRRVFVRKGRAPSKHATRTGNLGMQVGCSAWSAARSN